MCRPPLQVQAVAFHHDVGIVCHTGCGVVRLRAAGKGKKYSLTMGKPLEAPSSVIKGGSGVYATNCL